MVDPATRIAVEVNGVLSRYIAIHDDIFTFSLRRVIPIPGIFRPIKFDEHRHRLSALQDDLRRCDAAASAVIQQTPSPHRFLLAIPEYIDSLATAIDRLRAICDHLQAKTEGDESYTIAAHEAATAAYQESVTRYRDVGARLNSELADFQATSG